MGNITSDIMFSQRRLNGERSSPAIITGYSLSSCITFRFLLLPISSMNASSLSLSSSTGSVSSSLKNTFAGEGSLLARYCDDRALQSAVICSRVVQALA